MSGQELVQEFERLAGEIIAYASALHNENLNLKANLHQWTDNAPVTWDELNKEGWELDDDGDGGYWFNKGELNLYFDFIPSSPACCRLMYCGNEYPIYSMGNLRYLEWMLKDKTQ